MLTSVESRLSIQVFIVKFNFSVCLKFFTMKCWGSELTNFNNVSALKNFIIKQ